MGDPLYSIQLLAGKLPFIGRGMKAIYREILKMKDCKVLSDLLCLVGNSKNGRLEISRIVFADKGV